MAEVGFHTRQGPSGQDSHLILSGARGTHSTVQALTVPGAEAKQAWPRPAPHYQPASSPLSCGILTPSFCFISLVQRVSEEVYSNVSLPPSNLEFAFANRSPLVKKRVQVIIFSVCWKSVLLVSCHPGLRVISWSPQLPHFELWHLAQL